MTMLLDANVVLRYLTGDDPRKKARSERFLEAVAKTHEQVVVTSLCFAEIGWVLDRLYRYPKPMIVIALRRLLQTAGIEMLEHEVWQETVDLYERHAFSLIDAYHAAFMNRRKIGTIVSYDTDFDQVPGITRKEP